MWFLSTVHGSASSPLMDTQPQGCWIPPWQPRGGFSPQLPSLDADPGNQLFPFDAAAEKEESGFDRFIFRLPFFHFFKIYLRISVYLLGRTLSSPTEATTEPWKTTKSKGCTKKKSIVSVIPQLREHKYWSLKYLDNLNHQFWQQKVPLLELGKKKSLPFSSRAGNLSHPEKTKTITTWKYYFKFCQISHFWFDILPFGFLLVKLFFPRSQKHSDLSILLERFKRKGFSTSLSWPVVRDSGIWSIKRISKLLVMGQISEHRARKSVHRWHQWTRKHL